MPLLIQSLNGGKPIFNLINVDDCFIFLQIPKIDNMQFLAVKYCYLS